MTSVCPGMTKSDLGRQFLSNWFLAIVVSFLMNIVARKTEDGCNIYISALGKGEEVRGEMWKDDRVIGEEADKNVRSDEGK